jgi:hypothetical protein
MSVIVSLKNLEKKYNNVRGLIETRGMEQVGQKVKQLQLDQIDKKIDKHGKPFKPYTAMYADAKGKDRNDVTLVSNALKPVSSMSKEHQKIIYASLNAKGIKGKKGGSRKMKGGHMIHAIGNTAVRFGQVNIGFLSKNARDKAAWNFETREFFGLTKKNKKTLFDWIRKKFGV